jgi:hypothetical protein
MLVIKVLVTLFKGVGYLGFPSQFLHDLPGTKNGLFVYIMTVETDRVLDKMGIIDISSSITIKRNG